MFISFTSSVFTSLLLTRLTSSLDFISIKHRKPRNTVKKKNHIKTAIPQKNQKRKSMKNKSNGPATRPRCAGGGNQTPHHSLPVPQAKKEKKKLKLQ